jgi:parvulin-like peptidyl-prolyl isomerase
MLKSITISNKDILHHVQINCQIPEIIEQIVTRNIIISAIEEAGIKVETKELQKAADRIRLANKLHSAEDTWKWLEKYCLSLANFEEIVSNSLISAKLAAYLFADKVESYFTEHQLDYTSAVISEVVLDDRDLALKLFYAIHKGETSFSEVAHKYLQDTELRRTGGYRGIVCPQDLRPEISAAVFTAKPPQVLKPIVTCQGVHLILVEEISQPELDRKLRSEIMAHLFSEWTKQQYQQVEIVKKINLDSDTL